MNKDTQMTFIGHLVEIRSRLLKSAIAVVVASLIAFIFADQLMVFLTLPLKTAELVFIDMTEMLGVYLKVCLTAGIMAAMPYLLYHILMFVTPALTPKEKRSVFLVLPFIIIMFATGIAFSYFVLLPPAVQFLTSFGNEIATAQIRISSYISVATRIMLAAGIVFELPVISTFLARIGVITPEWMASKRKYAIVMAFILGATLTPPDVVSQILLGLPLIVLYEISIWLARLVQPKPVRNEALPEVPSN